MNGVDVFLRGHAFVHTQAVAPSDTLNIDYLLVRRTQLFDEAQWLPRLDVGRRDFGTGMSKTEMADLSERIDLPALWAYRDDVGRRTRTMVCELNAEEWVAPIEKSHIQWAADAGMFTPDEVTLLENFLPGRSRESALFWWGLNHTLIHLGQVAMLQGIVKSLSAPA